MDFERIAELHTDGNDRTAWVFFADMCREAILGEHRIGQEVSHLVHYTTLGALTSMLGKRAIWGLAYVLASGKPSGADEDGDLGGYLRLYDTSSVNDPGEGSFFVRVADKTTGFREKYGAVLRLFEDRSAAPAYQTSLTQVEDVAEADDLVFWRTYGSEGSGCALVIPVECFKDQVNLFRVRYGMAKAASCLNRLEELFEAYGEVVGAPDFHGELAQLPQPIVNVLSPLVYLYKSKAYEYEKEARMVIPLPDLKNGVYLQASSTADVPDKWRHFAQVPELEIGNLLVSGSWVLLGPTVGAGANVQFVLKSLLRQRGLYGPMVEPSTIAYRP